MGNPINPTDETRRTFFFPWKKSKLDFRSHAKSN